MSCPFARVLERELQSVGLPALAASSCAGETAAASLVPPRRSAVGNIAPAMPGSADNADFSARALSLSLSLRQYVRDANRPVRRDPFLVSGWNEAGYLRDTGRGLCGEMLFSTASGTLVGISAGSGREGDADVRVRAVKDGAEHFFSLDDFSDCRPGGTSPPHLPVVMSDRSSR